MKYHLRKSADDKPAAQLYTLEELVDMQHLGHLGGGHQICEAGQDRWHPFAEANAAANVVAKQLSKRYVRAYQLAGSLDVIAYLLLIVGTVLGVMVAVLDVRHLAGDRSNFLRSSLPADSLSIGFISVLWGGAYCVVILCGLRVGPLLCRTAAIRYGYGGEYLREPY
jgi:hypothetical protein